MSMVVNGCFIIYVSGESFIEQLSGSQANEIKHDNSPVVIVVLDPRYDYSYKALYIYNRNIALNQGKKFLCLKY